MWKHSDSAVDALRCLQVRHRPGFRCATGACFTPITSATRIRWQVGDLPYRMIRLDLRGRGVNDRRCLADLNRGRDSP